MKYFNIINQLLKNNFISQEIEEFDLSNVERFLNENGEYYEDMAIEPEKQDGSKYCPGAIIYIIKANNEEKETFINTYLFEESEGYVEHLISIMLQLDDSFDLCDYLWGENFFPEMR